MTTQTLTAATEAAARHHYETTYDGALSWENASPQTRQQVHKRLRPIVAAALAAVESELLAVTS